MGVENFRMKPEKAVSVGVRVLIDRYESCQGVLNSPSHLGISTRQTFETKLEQVKAEIARMVFTEGNQGLAIFDAELDKLDQERKKKYPDRGYVDYWMQAAESDPSPGMSEYYENEGRAASVGPKECLKGVDSIRGFLRTLR